jgi:integrase
MKARLTIKSVEAVQPGTRDIVLWDTELRGFGCKITPAGRRSYLLQYRTAEGVQRKPAIGAHGAIKPEQAREIARVWLGEIAKGNDPALVKKQKRDEINVGQLCDRYLSDHAATRKKRSSVRNDLDMIDRLIRPSIGPITVSTVTRSDISKLHHSLRGTPYQANRCLALLSKMFSLAERWALRPDHSNPATNIDRFPERARERYLTPPELRRLSDVLALEESRRTTSPAAILAIRLLLLTGRRLNEILTLQWSAVDLKGEIVRFEDTKTGALTMQLSPAALLVLTAAKATASSTAVYVITGKNPGTHLINLQKAWRKLRLLAGLEDVRLHDLRHTYASVAAGLGLSLPMIGKLLGHTQAATTARYAHLATDPVRTAAHAVGAAMSLALGSGRSEDT